MSGKPTHELSYTPEYRAWQTMVQRCTNPRNRAYPGYGGRGIAVCDRWLHDVRAFVEDMGPRPAGHELDRIDNDGPYSPENCRWTTRTQNSRNRRSNTRLTFRGEEHTLQDWCDVLGLSKHAVSKRLAAGWGAERALSEPFAPRSPRGSRHPNPSARCHVCGTATGLRRRTCSPRCRDELRRARALIREARKRGETPRTLAEVLRANVPELVARDEVAA